MTEKKTRYLDIFLTLTKRHLLVFFKNKVRLMYTLLVPVIIFAVYLLFLRGLELSMVNNILADPELGLSAGLISDPILHKHIETLIDSWMLSGILGLSTVTVALQTNTVFVEDKQNGVNRDFASSPIHRNLLIASYFLYNFIVSSLICFVFLIICLIYLACVGEFVLSPLSILFILVVMFFGTVTSTLMTIFICSFVKSEATMMSIVAIFSTAIGFLIGAFMPLGMMPTFVQGICGLIPGTYACSLLRYAFLDTPIANLFAYAENVGISTDILELIVKNFGYELSFFGISVSPQWQSMALSVFILVFLALNIGVGKKLSEVLGFGRKKK